MSIVNLLVLGQTGRKLCVKKKSTIEDVDVIPVNDVSNEKNF